MAVKTSVAFVFPFPGLTVNQLWLERAVQDCAVVSPMLAVLPPALSILALVADTLNSGISSLLIKSFHWSAAA